MLTRYYVDQINKELSPRNCIEVFLADDVAVLEVQAKGYRGDAEILHTELKTAQVGLTRRDEQIHVLEQQVAALENDNAKLVAAGRDHLEQIENLEIKNYGIAHDKAIWENECHRLEQQVAASQEVINGLTVLSVAVAEGKHWRAYRECTRLREQADAERDKAVTLNEHLKADNEFLHQRRGQLVIERERLRERNDNLDQQVIVLCDYRDQLRARLAEVVEALTLLLEWSCVLLNGYYPNEGDQQYALEQIVAAHAKAEAALAKAQEAP